MVKDDCILAQRILSGSKSNIDRNTLFHEFSPIYIKSNERTERYIEFLKNRKKVLSVIASSDQLLSMILYGTTSIDAFDISAFPKYYMYLKMAGIQNLSLEEYLSFFYEIDKDSEEYDEMYFYAISKTLDKEAKEFWDSIIDYFDWNVITSSSLFSSELISVADAIRQNDFLSEDNFNRLKGLISGVNINTHQGNILDIYKLFKDPYDLIYLSNIMHYVDRRKYKEMLEQLPLNEKGLILTYIYSDQKKVSNYFQGDEYCVHDLNCNGPAVLIKKDK